jgi:hypothetical protein
VVWSRADETAAAKKLRAPEGARFPSPRRGGGGWGVPQQTVSMVNTDTAIAGTTLSFGATSLCISTDWLCFGSIRRTGFAARASVSSPTTDVLAVRPGVEHFRSLRDRAGTKRASQNGGVLTPMGTDPRHQRPSGRISGGRARAITYAFVLTHDSADPSSLLGRSQPFSPLNPLATLDIHGREGCQHDARLPMLWISLIRHPAATTPGGEA